MEHQLLESFTTQIKNLRITQTLKTLQDLDMETSVGWKNTEYMTIMEEVVEVEELP